MKHVHPYDFLPPNLAAGHDDGAFRLELDGRDERLAHLLVRPWGSDVPPAAIWTRRFESRAERDAVLAQIGSISLGLAFHGRLAMIFGPDSLDVAADGILAEIHAAREAEREEANEHARKHRIVRLYTQQNKRGHVLELQRDSRDKADWRVVYDRAVERDRLCDWLRWQKARFLEFLDYAAEHGDEALTRMLTDEMFAAERTIKKEGRGAGGMRPLRMWRGD